MKGSGFEIEHNIYLFRGHRVMLDRDLAELYEVPTGQLNLAVRRNLKRFPADFMFQLSKQELAILRSQIATSRPEHGTHSKYVPYAFTEHGVTMLASVLNSDRAIRVNVAIVRAFVKLRELQVTDDVFAKKLVELERKFLVHDEQLKAVFAAIRELLGVGLPPQKKIGGLGEK